MTPVTANSLREIVEIPVIPAREVLPWAIFGLILAVITIYLVGAEQGAVAIFDGATIHEFVHDGRHLLGFPCH